MRRFLLLTVATMMTISMMAIGAGNGKDKANAIDFNWADGHTHEAGSALWYRVTLAQLSKEANDPTLALYLTNLTTDLSSVSLSVDAEVLGQKASKNSSYKIAGKGYEIWSLRTVSAAGKDWSLKELMSLGLNEVYVKLQSDKQIKLTAKAYKTEDIVDDACKNAVDFNWNGESVKAGEKWFMLNLGEVKASGKQLKFVVANKGTAAANVAFDMSLDCPASAVIEKDWVIAAGAEQEDEFGRVFLDVLKEDYVFLKLTTDQPLTLAVEEVVVLPPPPGKYDSFTCDAPILNFDEELNLTAGEHVYKVLRQDLIAARDYAYDFHVINNNSTAAKLTVETAFACPVKNAVEQTLTVEANEEIAVGIKGNVLASVTSEWVYLRMTAEQDLTAYIGVRNTNPCANATPFDWTKGASLQAGESQWYEMDITSLKQNKQHLKLNFVNHSSERAIVSVEVALDCNGTILPMTLPIPAGLNISEVIDYQLIARAPLNRIYVSVSTNQPIELATSVKNYIADDQTPCLNGIDMQHGTEYTHNPGTTWYKVSLDLLKSKADYSGLYFANKGNKTAHVTIGLTTSCAYTTGTTITIPIPAGLNLGLVAPNVLGNLIEELVRVEKVYNRIDAADVYLEVTTDQPLGLGLDVENTTTNPCLREDLLTFDWATGAQVNAGEPVWYDIDLTNVQNTGKHVKLTFTNNTDSLVWAASVVSVDCPAKLTMPLIVAVPAGMSVDKWIDYSFFAASRVDNIYLGVTTDGALTLGATAVDAIVTPSADCTNAVEVYSGMLHTQTAGTQWYNIPMSLLNDMGKAAKFSFRNLGTETAHLTAGATVGCEYSILTYSSFKMPKQLSFSLNVPTAILSQARKLVDVEVTNFYLQLTSDQDIVLGVDMDDNVYACADNQTFDWKAWENGGLQLHNNQEQWYQVNLRYPWEKMKKGEDLVLSVTNPNDVSVDVEAGLSPTCPTILTLESYATIPSHMTVQKVIEFSELARMLKELSVEVYDDETELILEKYQAWVVLNKIDQKLGRFGKFFPVSKLYSLLDKYGEHIAYTELKEFIDNRDKYLSKAELKHQLNLAKAEAKDQLSIEQAIQLVDKCGEYIPYEQALNLLSNYDKVMPYAGGAIVIIKKCETYIPTDDIKQFVKKAIDAIPMDKIKALFDKIEQRIPRDLNAYLRIKTTGDIIVEPDTVVPAPEGCPDAIEYIWGTDVVVNQEAWYKVSIADVRNKDCSITLTVTNHSADSVYADLSLYETCDADQAFITLKNVGIAPNTTRTKTISASELPADIDVIYLYVQPKGEMTINLSTDCPVFKYEYATIASYACGTEVLTWNDTVHVNSYLDSVYTYVVTPLAAPVAMNDSILATIPGAKPQLTPGTTPDMTASADSIKAYYLAQDNEATADVVKVEWAATPIACGATTHTMTLTVEDECGNQQIVDFTLNVTTPALDVTNHTVTICATELPYTWNGITYPTAGTHTTILSNIYGCDSAQVNMTINLYPAIPETIVDTTICHGESYTWNLNKQTYNQTGSDTITVASINGCDSVVILNLTVLPEIVSYDTVTVCFGETYYWHEASMNCRRDGDYYATLTSVAGCDSVVNLHVKWLPKVEKEAATVATICYDQIPYTWMGNTYSATGLYNDTTLNYLGCDSIIHTLELTVLKEAVTMPTEYATINEGATYTWTVNNKDYTTQGVYTHVVSNILGCDSLIYTLDLTVIPTHIVETKTITDLVCDGTEYIDPITGKKHIISSLIPSTQTWSDTVVVSSTLDSIYNFQITPIVAPEVMTDALLATITGATPVLTQGMLPNIIGTTDAILAYYNAQDNDTIADVTNIYWTNASVSTAIPCGATSHAMTLVVEAGCDNLITTTHIFDVQPIKGTDETVVACDSYTWNGTTYTASGNYEFKTTTVGGCDSIAILHLTINNSFSTVEKVTACDFYTWPADGKTYLNSGNFIYTTTATNGCDSIVTLQLTINKSYNLEETVTTCDSYTWPVDGKNYTKSGDYVYNGTTAAGCDSIVTLHLTVNPSYNLEETATACDSYTWSVDGKTYTKSGDYVYNGTTAAGCDSIVTLHLTVNKTQYSEEIRTECDSYNWYGMNLTANGVYQHTLQTVAGCDSIVTLRLTINKSYSGEETAVACDSYTWNGKTYTKSGDYVYNGKTAAGCDSIVTLHLTVNESFDFQEKVVTCDSYDWRGRTLTKSGIYADSLLTVAGCDSIYTLDLTINKAYHLNEYATACDSYTWNGKTYTKSGDYVYNGKTAAGCDSIVTLHLTVNESYNIEETVVTCDSYTWFVNGNTYTTSGDYVYNGTTATGCDSIVTLHLTILPDMMTRTESAAVCPNELPYIWRGQSLTQAGTYTVTEKFVGTDCDSIAYVLTLQVYALQAPATHALPIAICSKAVDVSAVNAEIETYIDSTMYADNAQIAWYIKNESGWTPLTTDPIAPSVKTVVLKYVITTDCGTVESEEYVVVVERLTPENDADMNDLEAVSKYGNRIMLLDLNYIHNTLGWNIKPEHVTWYQVVGQKDIYGLEGDDKPLGHGFYYNEEDASPLVGEYYALIVFEGDADHCAAVARTKSLILDDLDTQIKLTPTVVQPGEKLTLTNLDTNMITDVKVYSSTGMLLSSFTAKYVGECTFLAQDMIGVYMVIVSTENYRVTLRYMVN